jgi:hypothetical protein
MKERSGEALCISVVFYSSAGNSQEGAMTEAKSLVSQLTGHMGTSLHFSGNRVNQDLPAGVPQSRLKSG